MRIMEISTYMGPLDKIISQEFIPTLLGCPISPIHRELMSLPLKNGGLGIPILENLAKKEYATSIIATRNLVIAMETSGCSESPPGNETPEELQEILKQRVLEYKEQHQHLLSTVDKKTARVLEQISEPGSSNWLSCLPLRKHGFIFNKSEFRDCIRLRYNIDLGRLPSHCACGKVFDVNHALNCHRGGYIIIRHNAVRDFLAGLVTTVCSDVEVEPSLQPLEGEEFAKATTLTGDQARPDIRARGFFRAGQHAFFDVKVMNPNSETTKKVYETAESQKARAYNERILNVEHGSFAPLIFSVTGGMGRQAITFSKLLCRKIAYKKRQDYNDIINFYRCKLSFLIRKHVLLCIRGSRGVIKEDNNISKLDDFEFMSFESKVN